MKTGLESSNVFIVRIKRGAVNLGGAGLGLAIAEWIVTQHRGRVIVQSTPGKGSAFLVELPLQLSAEATFAQPPVVSR